MNMEMAEQIRKRIELIKQQWQAVHGTYALVGQPKGELEALQWVLDTLSASIIKGLLNSYKTRVLKFLF